MKDLIGKRFGKLTVSEKTDRRISNRIVWLCKCDCGNIAYVTSSHLTNGNTKSCGCLISEVKIENLINNKYGRLTIIKPTKKRLGNSVIWECKCDCGNKAYVAAINLKTGRTKSCGCFASEIHKNTISKAKEIRKNDYVYNTDIKQLMKFPQSNNTSGITGVSWDSSINLWKAHITFQHKRYYLGSSTDKNYVIRLRKKAEQKIHGEFLNWYKKRKEIDKMFKVCFGTGAGDFKVNGDLEQAMKEANEAATYTQQSIRILDDNDEIVAQRIWIGCRDGMGNEMENPIYFGQFGYYADWEKY